MFIHLFKGFKRNHKIKSTNINVKCKFVVIFRIEPKCTLTHFFDEHSENTSSGLSI